MSEAIEALVEEHEGPLCRYAFRMLGDVEAARDVVQETFLRLVKHPPFTDPEHAKAWLFRVCRTRALDHVRKEKRMSALSDATLESQAANSPAPGAALERRETQHHLLSALTALPNEQQEVIRLKFQDGLTYKQIAEVVNAPSGTVGYLIHVGLKTLREKMATA